MKHTIDTIFGEVEISTAMVDIDGTNLEEGVVIRVDGIFVKELINYSVSDFEKFTEEEMETFLKKQCDL